MNEDDMVARVERKTLELGRFLGDIPAGEIMVTVVALSSLIGIVASTQKDEKARKHVLASAHSIIAESARVKTAKNRDAAKDKLEE